MTPERAAGQPFVAMLLGLFALLSLPEAIVGIYGVLSYQVTQRTREIGARIAFGASRSQLLSLVMGDASRLIGAGLAIGVGGAIAARRVLAGSLQVIKANAPATVIVATLCLALVGVAACCVPARRASRLDPRQGPRSATRPRLRSRGRRRRGNPTWTCSRRCGSRAAPPAGTPIRATA